MRRASGIAAFAVTALLVAAGTSSAHASGSYYRVVQYPGAGFGGLYAQIHDARRTIDMEMYELEDTTAEADLVAAAKRGVRVRVLLDSDYDAGGVNAVAYGYLKRHGVDVRWAPSGYIFHIKVTVFDGHTADVSTANLTSRYYATTRDAEIVDTNPVQVRAIERTFGRDFAAGPAGSPAGRTAQAPGLVWSPDAGSGTAQTAMVMQIDAARRSVEFESEELSDPAVYDALAYDARRGVSCEVVMTDSSRWRTGFAAVRAAGCRVRVYPDSAGALYIHEKLILDDHGAAGESLLIGSQNASDYSLTRNRELSVRLTRAHGGAAVIGAVSATFASDYDHAEVWSSGGSNGPSAGAGGSGQSGGAGGSSGPSTSCHPTTSAGHCYEAGEYCSSLDHGLRGVAGDGEAIECEDDDGWRWQSA